MWRYIMCSYICVSSRNMGFVILKYLGVVMGISLVTGILSGAIVAMQMLGGQETLLKVLEVIQNINIYNYFKVYLMLCLVDSCRYNAVIKLYPR